MAPSVTGVRFLHTSDWQLGMTRHFLQGEAQARYAGARLDAVRALGALARDRRCDFVLVAGDVFDSNLLSSQTVRRTLDVLGAIEAPVYLLPGNHDAYNAATIYRSPVFRRECPPNVHVLAATGGTPVAPGVELLAAPLLSNAPLTDPTAEVLADLAADGTRRILVGHGQIDVLAPESPGPSAIRLAALEAAIEAGSVHYVALGDRHSRLSVGGTGRVHYSGSPEVTDFRDTAAGEVLVVDLAADGSVSTEAVRVGRWRFLDWTHDIANGDDIATLDAELAAVADADRTVVRHALVGTLSLADNAALYDVLNRHADRLAGCFPWDAYTDLVVCCGEDDLAALPAGGYLGAAVAQRRRGAAADATAGDALALLYRLARTEAR
ncbi:MAG: metallophosphoesterase [Austwickia sp.]|nr:metallophosphoesterase [Austwickia sp.]